ncbi:MAG: peptide chain release factor N(5)-glutamine methyltransferase [Anaerolineae bacterium]
MADVTTIGTALARARKALSAVSDSPQLDAHVLLAHVLGVVRATLIAHPERVLTAEQAAAFDALVARAAGGEPVPYLIGERAFYRHDFSVTPDVLIPRPETEHLVEATLNLVRRLWPDSQGLALVDVGTGSGAIAVSLAAALPGVRMIALDISPAALAVARRNAARVGVALECYESDLLEGLPADVQPAVIVSNPPYIPTAELATLEVAQHEPRLALDGGPDGLAVIRRLVTQAAERLVRPGALLMEIGSGQGAAVQVLCESAFSRTDVRVLRDYAGHERVVEVVAE